MPSGPTHVVGDDGIPFFCMAEYRWVIARDGGWGVGETAESGPKVQTSSCNINKFWFIILC